MRLVSALPLFVPGPWVAGPFVLAPLLSSTFKFCRAACPRAESSAGEFAANATPVAGMHAMMRERTDARLETEDLKLDRMIGR